MRRLPIDVVAVAATVSVAALLTLVSLAQALRWLPAPHDFRVLWDTASEANIWTWSSVTVLLLGTGAHLAAAYMRWCVYRPAVLLWVLTALVLAAMSLDDLVSLHERLFRLGVIFGGGSGLTFFAWVIPGAMIALVINVLFAVLIARVGKSARRYLATGLALFFTGALGVEMIGGAINERRGYSDIYVMVYHLEEMLEAAGAAFLMGAGLADLPDERRPLGFWLTRGSRSQRLETVGNAERPRHLVWTADIRAPVMAAKPVGTQAGMSR